MGWKGAMRSMAAAARAAERDARRRQRELERQQRQYEKMEELEQAAYEVDIYENYLERITSVHKEVRPDVDWQKINDDPRPAEPVRSRDNEKQARTQLETYRPGFVSKLFGSAEKKKQGLESAIQMAIEEDDEKHRIALKDHEKDLAEWLEQSNLARKILDHDPHTYATALKAFGSFSEIEELEHAMS